MGMKKLKDDRQLSLFDQQATDVPNFNHFKESFVIDPEKVTSPKPLTSVVDFVRARFDANPNMDPEEYKRWIKILISSSLKRMECPEKKLFTDRRRGIFCAKVRLNRCVLFFERVVFGFDRREVAMNLLAIGKPFVVKGFELSNYLRN
jgi:hypothetical protein